MEHDLYKLYRALGYISDEKIFTSAEGKPTVWNPKHLKKCEGQRLIHNLHYLVRQWYKGYKAELKINESKEVF